MHERRLTLRLTSYWDGLRGDRSMPLSQQLNAEAIADVSPKTLLVRVISAQGNRPLYQYEYMGEEIILAYGRDLTHEYANAKMHNFPGARLLARLDEMLQAPRLVVDEGQFVNSTSKVIRYRACMVPFGDMKGQVTHVLIGLSWQSY